jgi:hypothetical protein
MIEQINQQRAAQGKGPFQWKTIPQGAATSVWAAVVASAAEVGGQYCEDCHVSHIVPDDLPVGVNESVRRYAARSKNRRGALEEKRRNGWRVVLAFLIMTEEHRTRRNEND